MKNLTCLFISFLFVILPIFCFSQTYNVKDLNIIWLDKDEIIKDKSPTKKFFFIEKNGKFGIRNEEGKLIVPFDFDEIGFPRKGLINVKVNDLWGYYNYEKNTFAIEPQFLSATHFANGTAEVKTQEGSTIKINTLGEHLGQSKKRVVRSLPLVDWVRCSNGKIRLEKKDGTEIKPCIFKSINYYHNVGVFVNKDIWSGFYNMQGEEIFAPEYPNIKNAKNGLLKVWEKRADGRIRSALHDITGKLIVPDTLEVQWISNNGQRLAVSSLKSKKWFFLDGHGNKISTPAFQTIHPIYKDHLFRITKDNKNGLIDLEGKEVVPVIYDEISHFQDGLALVNLKNRWGKMDTLGQTIVSPSFEAKSIYDYSEGFYLFKTLDQKVGIIDRQFNILVEPIYDKIKKVKNGIARVYKDKQWGTVEVKGNGGIAPSLNSSTSNFNKNGLAILRDGSKKGIINREGKILVEPVHDRIEIATDQLAMIFKEDKIGFVNFKTGKVISPQYERGIHFNNGFAAVRKGSLWGIMNHTGKIVLPLVFESNVIPQFSDPVAVKYKGRFGILRLPLPKLEEK